MNGPFKTSRARANNISTIKSIIRYNWPLCLQRKTFTYDGNRNRISILNFYARLILWDVNKSTAY